MPILDVTDPQGNRTEVEFRSGDTLMETLRDAGFEDEIAALCGGNCSCATCHVWLSSELSGDAAEIDEDEQSLLELVDDYQADKSRLSCQITLADEMHGLQIQLLAAS